MKTKSSLVFKTFKIICLLLVGISSNAFASTNVYETLKANPNFSTLVGAIDAAGLASALSSTQGITVFAPNNMAFDRITLADYRGLTSDKKLLTKILLEHVVKGVISAQGGIAKFDAASASTNPPPAGRTFFPSVQNLAGTNDYLSVSTSVGSTTTRTLLISSEDNIYSNAGMGYAFCKVVNANIAASNGLIQGIDCILDVATQF